MLIQKVKFIACLAFLITIALLSGCATSHKVRHDKIDHSKTYRIGIIKVTGTNPLPLFKSGLPRKIEALKNIQHENICKIIENTYNITIDKQIKNSTPLLVVEYDNRNTGRTHPYIGNDIYVQISPIAIGPLFRYYKRENIDDNGHIDIIYRFTFDEGFGFNNNGKYYYEVVIRDNNEEVILHKDLIASIPVPSKSIGNLITGGLDTIISNANEMDESMWQEVISNAGKIDETLLEDINEQK